ncbi:MAG TPA: hypothetical protein VKD22_01700, partial [Ramlibacter sp.]|nr:hypothetical protein [Ramlibacter sp.]
MFALAGTLAEHCPFSGIHVCASGAKRPADERATPPPVKRPRAGGAPHHLREPSSQAASESSESGEVIEPGAEPSETSDGEDATEGEALMHKNNYLFKLIRLRVLRAGDEIAVGRGPEARVMARIVERGDDRWALERVDPTTKFRLALQSMWHAAFPNGPAKPVYNRVWRVRGEERARLSVLEQAAEGAAPLPAVSRPKLFRQVPFTQPAQSVFT